jgi:hypothetical protein
MRLYLREQCDAVQALVLTTDEKLALCALLCSTAPEPMRRFMMEVSVVLSGYLG